MSDRPPAPRDPAELASAHTPARVLAGRAGTAYRTGTWLKLREDHAAARDAVHDEADLVRDFGADRVARFGLWEARTRAGSKAEYLRRPGLGRTFDEATGATIRARCPAGADLQVVIGDGLSAPAVAAQAPGLLDRLHGAAGARGWSFGQPFFVRYCRVGAMNDIGDWLSPTVLVLLIGERPGLATAESLSAYLAYRPRGGHTDADRNLVSNIHARGVTLDEATHRIVSLAYQYRAVGRSGVGITEGGDRGIGIGESQS